MPNMSYHFVAMKPERLINYNNARLTEYNKRIQTLEEFKQQKIDELEQKKEGVITREDQNLEKAQNNLDRALEIDTGDKAQDRIIRANGRKTFRTVKFESNRRRRKNLKKLDIQIRLINRKHPERLLGDTQTGRQHMYRIATWARTFRKSGTYLKNPDTGKRTGTYKETFSPVSLSISYPTSDLNLYVPLESERCVKNYNWVCRGEEPQKFCSYEEAGEQCVSAS